MKLLFDIGHPAHVHYFKNLAKLLIERGHNVFWTTKPIPSVIKLLDAYGFKYRTLPRKRDGFLGKVFFQIIYDLIVLKFCSRNKINLALGTSVTVAHVSRISRVKSIVFDDDDDGVQPLVTKYVHPFADVLLSPDCLLGKRRHIDTIFYPGYHELAYLHPRRFIPDQTVLKDAGLTLDEPFFLMRFNVFKAHHDVGIKGLTLEQKLIIIEMLNPSGRVLITTERNMEPELQKYQLSVNPEKIHSLLFNAKMFIGDSQTMTSEAAVLGVPSLRCNSFAGKISYLEEQEKKYGLTYAFLPENFDKMVLKLQEMLSNKNLKKEWQIKRTKMLSEKIDVTAFWTWFIDNYPESKKVALSSSEHYNRFK